MDFDKILRQRKSVRLKGYDYSRPGYYFVTICSYQRELLFGEINNREMEINEWGKIVERTWFDLPNHINNIILDSFVIMPNHVHGVIRIVGAGSKPARFDHSVVINKDNGADLDSAPTKNHPLSEIVRQFKTFSVRKINISGNCPGFGTRMWQRNYYEHIVRNQEDLNKIREYIKNNPGNWLEDENNPENLI